MDLKRIPMKNLHNMRDLGGYPTADGRMTKWNRLYRSDSPSSLTADEWAALKNLGVNLFIDLRSEQEREASPVKPGYPADYEAISLMKELDDLTTELQSQKESQDSGQATEQIMKSMELDYTRTLFGNLTGAVKILDLILNNARSGGNTLFFCFAGKDRTGITAAIVLYMCGVSREDIIADYMVSSTYNEKGANQMLSEIPKELLDLLPDEETLKKSMGSDPETMACLLDSFESRDILKALAENGFGADKQKELKDLMTEGGASWTETTK